MSANEQSPSHMKRRNILRLLSTVAVLPALSACDDDEKQIVTGHRTPVLTSVDGLTVAKKDDSQPPVTIPPQVPSEVWPQAGKIPSHVSANYAWPGTRKRLWSRSIGASISEPDFLAWAALGANGRGIIQAQPVIADGRIFVMDAQGHIRAFTWPGMKMLWHLNPKPRKMQSSNLGGGLGVEGATLYIVDGISNAIAVDVATGKEKWRVDIGTPGRSAPTIVDGRVYFGTLDERLFALDASTGNQLWTFASSLADTIVFGQPAPAVVDGVVLAGFGSGELVALRADSGEVVWSDTLASINGQASSLDLACIRGMPVIVDGTAYAISVAAVLVAIDMRSGRRLWERAVPGQNAITCVGDWLFVSTLGQQVTCIDRQTGQVRWLTQLRDWQHLNSHKGIIVWTGPVLAGDKLVMVSTLPENGLLTMDPLTGKILSIDSLPSPTIVQPIVSDGKLLLLSDDGYLTAYG
ncbi:MAG: PQQ-binding-like beta-propeller repeat protein [Acetobacter sp.]|nr:PQQ-binding-like beta-propeller repeat protein [Acetobacter sp.]